MKGEGYKNFERETIGAESRGFESGKKYPEFPMDEHRREIVECIRDNRNAVIVGETGSGKTTRIPDFLLDEFPDLKIAITQPRRVAARSVARYVAERRGQEVGQKVGYQVRFDDQTTEGTRANFMTDGILLKKMQYDSLLEEFDLVMVDEAHERNLNIDFSLGLLKRVQRERHKQGKKELKIVVASATIEKEKFAKFLDDSPVVEVEGRMHPVEVFYKRERVANYIEAAAGQVKHIVESRSPGDILIFMPGEDDITRTMNEIEKFKLAGIDVMPLFGAMNPEDQDRVFAANPSRKVIVATNIAETSVTIDGVKHVIDTGLIKQKEFNPETGIEALVVKEHAKSGCEQRKGRAGRTAPGKCYRLYTEQEYRNRPDYQTPEISRSNLDHVILAMKKMGISDVRGFEFIDRPDEGAFLHAIENLKALGALDSKEELTEIGDKMAELPLKPELARMVIEAEKYGCVGSVCTIASMIGGQKPIFVRPKDKQLEADMTHSKFKVSGSDFLTSLKVWQEWQASGFDGQWARDNFLNGRQLLENREVRAQLLHELGRLGIVAEDEANGKEAIQKCISAGLVQNLMTGAGYYAYRKIDLFTGHLLGEDVFIHPSSSVFHNRPMLMIGSEIVATSKTYARRCQEVKPQWLLDIAPQLLREAGRSSVYDPSEDQVVETVFYSLLAGSDTIAEKKQPAENNDAAAEQFAIACANGEANLQSFYLNRATLRQLQSIRDRSGGLVEIPNLKDWYKEKLAGAASRKEAERIDEQLEMEIGDFISANKMAEINNRYPEIITAQGHDLRVSYAYEPNPEKFTATIHIPQDLIFSLDESDFLKIGKDGRPEVFYICEPRDGQGYRDLETAKNVAQDETTKQALLKFRRLNSVKIEARRVSLDSEGLGFSPVAIGETYKGEQIFAYPGIRAAAKYDFNKERYANEFFIDYYETPEIAEAATQRAIELKREEEDYSAQQARIKDRESLRGGTESSVFGERLSLRLPGEQSGEKRESKKPVAPASAEIKKPPEPEKMTDEQRAGLIDRLNEAKLFIDSVARSRAPDRRDRRYDKTVKVIGRAKELREEWGRILKDVEATDNHSSAEGKVLGVVKKSEKIAGEMARVEGENEQWPENYRTYMVSAGKLAEEIGAELDDNAWQDVRKKLLKVARDPAAPKNAEELNELFGNIILEAI